MSQKNKVTIGHVFKPIVWPRKNLLFVGLILIVISRLASLVLPAASKYLMDEVIAKSDMEMLKILLLAVAGAIIVQAITSYLLTKLLSVEAQHLISVLRAKVQKQLLRLPTRFFDNNKSGALVSRVMNDVEGVRNLVGTGLVQLVGGVLSASISLVLLIRISPMMTLYVLVPVLVFGDRRRVRRPQRVEGAGPDPGQRREGNKGQVAGDEAVACGAERAPDEGRRHEPAPPVGVREVAEERLRQGRRGREGERHQAELGIGEPVLEFHRREEHRQDAAQHIVREVAEHEDDERAASHDLQ